MILHKVIEIDLELIRKRIRSITGKSEGFTKAQADRQLRMLAMFEAGKFAKAIAFVKTWPDDKKLECTESEFIDEAVWNVLWGIALGEQYVVCN
jgi:hypothetical protein